MNTNVTQKEAKLGLIAQNWTKYIFKKSTEKKRPVIRGPVYFDLKPTSKTQMWAETDTQ